MTVTPEGAPYRPAYIRAKNGLYYRIGVSTTMDAPTTHDSLSGLDADDHPQYLLPAEVIGGDNITVDTTTLPGSVVITGTAQEGVTAHHLLTGLTGSDDHTQYHTDERGDARYLKKFDDDFVNGVVTSEGIVIETGSDNVQNYPPPDIKFVTNGDARWSIAKGSSATINPEDPNIGRDLVFFKHELDAAGEPTGRMFPSVYIDHHFGRLRTWSPDGAHGEPEEYVTFKALDWAMQEFDGPVTNQGTFVAYNLVNSAYTSNNFWGHNSTVHFQGMFRPSANLALTAGTEYAVCKVLLDNAGVNRSPLTHKIWPGGVYSLTGATSTSIVCRLRIDNLGVVRFLATASGTMTTNGWVSVDGHYSTLV